MPIGNIEDITIRALRILKSVDYIIAENGIVTRKLLSFYGISAEITTFRKGFHENTAEIMIERLREGKSAALVCDAGTPLIADPGLSLVQAAIRHKIRVYAIPGASALLSALIVSGLPANPFVFVGFPPRGGVDRIDYFKKLTDESRTIIIYETQAYIAATLKELLDVLGSDRQIVIARNLTKSNEDIYYGSLESARLHFAKPPRRGEYVVVARGKGAMPSLIKKGE